jgi:hypothetical protein
VIRETIVVTATWIGTHHHPSMQRELRHNGHPHEHQFSVRVTVQQDMSERGTHDAAQLRERVQLWCLDHLTGPADASLERMARQVLDQLRVWYGRDRGLSAEVSDGTGLAATCSLPYVGRPGRPPRAEVPV